MSSDLTFGSPILGLSFSLSSVKADVRCESTTAPSPLSYYAVLIVENHTLI